MKRFILAVLSLAAFSGFAFAGAENQFFTVEADAVVRARPDRVLIGIGVLSKGRDLAETKKKNSDIIKKAIDSCVKAGVPAKNIKTDYVNIRPEFRNYETLEKNFSVDQNLSVMIEDISKYDEILTELLNIGMNQVRYIEFQTSDLKKYKNESRKLAIAAAKERAEFLALEAGIKLGDIVNLTDAGINWPPYARGVYGSYANTVQNAAISGGGQSGGGEDSFAPGMVSVKSNITLTYEIKRK